MGIAAALSGKDSKLKDGIKESFLNGDKVEVNNDIAKLDELLESSKMNKLKRMHSLISKQAESQTKEAE